MFHRNSIERFLETHDVPEGNRIQILLRADEAAEYRGMFSGARLMDALGDRNTVDAFHAAWEKDPTIQEAGYTPN